MQRFFGSTRKSNGQWEREAGSRKQEAWTDAGFNIGRLAGWPKGGGSRGFNDGGIIYSLLARVHGPRWSIWRPRARAKASGNGEATPGPVGVSMRQSLQSESIPREASEW